MFFCVHQMRGQVAMRKLYKLITLLILALFLGCATKPKIDLIDENVIKIDKIPSETIVFKKIAVHQHYETTEIEVIIRPKKLVRRFLSGNLKLTIFQPNGVQQDIVVTKAHKDTLTSGHKTQHSHFTTILPYTLQADSAIKIEHLPAK